MEEIAQKLKEHYFEIMESRDSVSKLLKDIQVAEQQLENGEGIPHEEVKRLLQEKTTMKRMFDTKAKCGICGEEVAVKQMLKHLKACRQAHPLKEGKRQQEIFTLRVTSPEYPGYFLYLEIEGGQRLFLLDGFLRDIWLECCGHMSQFIIDGIPFWSASAEELGEDLDDREDMSAKLQVVLEKGPAFQYEYDFGSTTYLKLEVVDVRETKEKLPKGLLLVARNLTPEIGCKKCKAPATRVILCYDKHDGAYCEACAEKLPEENQDVMLPVVNSPRMGVCGYTG